MRRHVRGMTALCGLALLVSSDRTAGAAAPNACKEPEVGTSRAPILSPPLGKVVVGPGRLQFHSAPNPACRMDGVFVVPRDALIAYAETDDGWTSVMYLNPKNGDDVQGWVRSDRLRTTGTMGPRP